MRVTGADRRRAIALADQFDDFITPTFEIDQFVAACSGRNTTHIEIVEDASIFDGDGADADATDENEACTATLVTGMAVTFRDGGSLLLLRSGLAPVHRAHVIAHELAHLLFEHHPKQTRSLSDRQIRYLFGDELFSPDTVRKLLVSRLFELERP